MWTNGTASMHCFMFWPPYWAFTCCAMYFGPGVAVCLMSRLILITQDEVDLWESVCSEWNSKWFIFHHWKCWEVRLTDLPSGFYHFHPFPVRGLARDTPCFSPASSGVLKFDVGYRWVAAFLGGSSKWNKLFLLHQPEILPKFNIAPSPSEKLSSR